MSAVVTVTHLRKSFKKGFIPKRNEVLRDLSFSIKGSSVTGFLGANGAGKTTTMKCLLGLVYPDQGEIKFFGEQNLSQEVKRRIGFLPEHPYFYHYLTGFEFLWFYGQLSTTLKKKDLKIRIERLFKQMDLLSARDRKLREYSKGMLQKMGMAQAIIHDPDLVVLDEPMSGLDPDGRYYLSEIIRDLAHQGKSVFFSSHHLFDAERLCENLIIIRSGQLVYQGQTEELLSGMNNSTTISYWEKGQKQHVQVHSLSEVQMKLEQLRKVGAEIYDVRQDRMSLEEAFVKLALRGSEV